MARSIIHPNLFSRLTKHFYTSTVTIQENTPTPDTAGQLQPSWSNLADHVDIPCAIAPADGDEVKRDDQTYAITTHFIALAGHYPNITAQMRAVVSGTNYDILLPEHDSQGKHTRLRVKVVT